MFIRFIPVDLRWGVLKEESKDCFAIQKTCLNQIDKCRLGPNQPVWFLGLRTSRYGWIQDKHLHSDGFEKPQYYGWLDTFSEFNKNVSITSLECIHALDSLAGSARFPSPTTFFYKRSIVDEDAIPEKLKWIYDYEFTAQDMDEEVKLQYETTEKCQERLEDKRDLDKHIQTAEHVGWCEYEAKYDKVEITGSRSDGKKIWCRLCQRPSEL